MQNQGGATVRPSRYDGIYLSTDPYLDSSDIFLADHFTSVDIAPEGQRTFSRSVSLPSGQQDRPYLLVQADSRDNRNLEGNETNNVAAASTLITSPDLVVTDVTIPDQVTWGEVITVSWTVQNQGGATVRPSRYDGIYLSTDPYLDSSDIFLTDHFTSVDIAPGGQRTFSRSVSLPSDQQDKPYLLVQADYLENRNLEGNEANNAAAASTLITSPDLVVTDVTIPDQVTWGEAITVRWTVQNQGGATVRPSRYDGIYLSTDPYLDSSDIFLADNFTSVDIAPGGQRTFSRSVTLPSGQQDRPYLLVQADSRENRNLEGNEANNVAAASTLITSPDLVVTDVTIPDQVTWGETITVRWTVQNQGGATVSPSRYDGIYLSSDPYLDSSDVFLADNFTSTNIVPGEQRTFSRSVTLPSDQQDKPYLLVQADSRDNRNLESHEANNSRSVNLTDAAVPETPDLVISDVQVDPESGNWTDGFDVTWTVTNQGDTEASAIWHDQIYLSADATYDVADRLLHIEPVNPTIPLAPGESYATTARVALSPVDDDVPYLVIITDRANAQAELDDSNNVLAVAHGMTPADLVVTVATVPSNATWGETIPITWTVTNQGQDTAQQTDWFDYIYVSADQVLDDSDTLIRVHPVSRSTSLEAGADYTITDEIAVPFTEQDKPYLLFATDRDRGLTETDETNNVLAVAHGLSDPDLVITAATVPIDASWGTTIPVSWTVENQSNVLALGDWSDYIYLSDDPELDLGDRLIHIHSVTTPQPLAPGGSYTVDLDVDIPAGEFDRPYLLFATDRDQDQAETDDTNNLRSVLALNHPDLAITNVSVPDTAAAGETFEVSWTVTNQGIGTAVSQGWFDYIYASSDLNFDADTDTLIESVEVTGITPLEAGESYSFTRTITLPTTVADDPYLLFVSDRENFQRETDKANNSQAIVLQQSDLVVSEIGAPPTASRGETVPITWTVENRGTQTTTASWSDFVYLSDDEVFDSSDILVAQVPTTGVPALGGGDSYQRTHDITIPTGTGNQPYLLVVTDHNNDQLEVNTANNVGGVAAESPNPRPGSDSNQWTSDCHLGRCCDRGLAGEQPRRWGRVGELDRSTISLHRSYPR